jgi:hypothetical protein
MIQELTISRPPTGTTTVNVLVNGQLFLANHSTGVTWTIGELIVYWDTDLVGFALSETGADEIRIVYES